MVAIRILYFEDNLWVLRDGQKQGPENSTLYVIRLYNFTQALFAKESNIYCSPVVVIFIVAYQII